MTRHLVTRIANRWDLVFGLVSAVLAITGLWANGSIVTQQRQLSAASHYDAVFDAGQLRTLLMQLEADVATALAPGAAVGRDAIGLRTDMVRNALGVMRSGALRALVASDPDIAGTLDAVGDALDCLSHALPRLADPTVQLDMIRRLRALNAPTGRMVALVNARSGDLVHAYQASLAASYQGTFILVIGLVVSGLSLVTLLIWRTWQATRIARTDAVTGLLNRQGFSEKLDEAARSADTRTGVFVVDIDGFRSINQTFGEKNAHHLLKTLADRLAAVVPRPARFARTGIDNLAVMVQGVAVDETLLALGEALRTETVRPVDVGTASIRFSACAGIAVADPGCETGGLLRAAELALAEAKAVGRGTLRHYTAEIADGSRRRQQDEADLEAAIAGDRLDVWFQPIVSLTDRAVVSCEALVRWPHPTRGLVPPGEFIPLAEQCGLIEQLDAWVLNKACRIAMTWPAPIGVSVNLSARQFRNDRAIEVIRDALHTSGLPPCRLELEVTESVLIQDAAAAIALLDAFKRLGLRVALDDFGTGFASLSYLHQFSFDKLKIDQSFVRDLARKPQSSVILEAIVTMARRLGITTTAEGIETIEQWKRVQALGCDQGQGYLFARPLKPASVHAFLSLARVTETRPQAPADAAGRAA